MGVKPHQNRVTPMTTKNILTGDAERFVRSARVARLASAAPDGRPHVIPVCFEVMDGSVYIGLDAKPKSVDALRLRRVRNIVSNPQAALIVDRYDEDWDKLGYALITASATVELDERERAAAVRALKLKYPQYQTMLPDDAYVIKLTPIRVTTWGDLTPF